MLFKIGSIQWLGKNPDAMVIDDKGIEEIVKLTSDLSVGLLKYKESCMELPEETVIPAKPVEPRKQTLSDMRMSL